MGGQGSHRGDGRHRGPTFQIQPPPICATAFVAVALLVAASCSSSDTEAAACCPRDDDYNSACVNLGGTSEYGCGAICDFWCTENWRVERDEHGCSVWRYDGRDPAPGESLLCLPKHDAGPAQ